MSKFNVTISSVALAAALLSSVGLAGARADQPSGSVFNVLSSDPRFTTTMQMVYVAGAANRLSTAGELTVFAPTNTAWESSSDTGMLSSLSSTGAGSEFPDAMDIVRVLRGFFVHGAPPAGATQVKLTNGDDRTITFDEKTMRVSWTTADGQTKSARVDGRPIIASNGVVYPVDAVVGE